MILHGTNYISIIDPPGDKLPEPSAIGALLKNKTKVQRKAFGHVITASIGKRAKLVHEIVDAWQEQADMFTLDMTLIGDMPQQASKGYEEDGEDEEDKEVEESEEEPVSSRKRKRIRIS